MYLLIRFFAGGPYRFLFVPLAGLAFIGWGTCAAAHRGRVYTTPELVFLGATVALHLALLFWYGRIVVRGEARHFWAEVLDFLDKMGSERR
jgi:hypothetical protein